MRKRDGGIPYKSEHTARSFRTVKLEKKVEKLNSRGRDWTKRNIVTERKFIGQNDTDTIYKVLNFV